MTKTGGTVKSGILRGLDELDVKILKELYDNHLGIRSKTLLKLLSTSRTSLYRRLNKLQKLGLIANIYPMWKIQALSKKWDSLLKCDNIQFHKFSFVLTLIRKPSWWNKRSNKLMKLKEFMFKNVNWGNMKYTQLAREDVIIQANPNSIVIINRKKYWGKTAYDCFIDGVEDIFELIRFLEDFYKIKLTLEGIPHMNIRSNHFVELQNALAERCKEDQKGFMVEVGGEKRIWVDFSIPFGLEYGHKDHALDDYKRLNPFFSDMLQQDQILLYSDLIKKVKGMEMALQSMSMEVLSSNGLNDKPDYVG